MLASSASAATAAVTHHVHILTMNGESYRLTQSTDRRRMASKAASADTDADERIDQDTGEILPA